MNSTSPHYPSTARKQSTKELSKKRILITGSTGSFDKATVDRLLDTDCDEIRIFSRDERKPDAVLILGDTNSCLAAISAKRRKIPVFHMEAGNL